MHHETGVSRKFAFCDEGLLQPRLLKESRQHIRLKCFQFWNMVVKSNPYLVKHIKSIESVQRRATRVICGSKKEYQGRLGILKWPLLQLRRKFICLVQMYKIIFGHCDIDPHTFFDFTVKLSEAYPSRLH